MTNPAPSDDQLRFIEAVQDLVALDPDAGELIIEAVADGHKLRALRAARNRPDRTEIGRRGWQA